MKTALRDATCHSCGTNAVKLRRIVRWLVRAEIDNSWKGGGDPLQVPIIESELRKAKRAWEAELENITRWTRVA